MRELKTRDHKVLFNLGLRLHAVGHARELVTTGVDVLPVDEEAAHVRRFLPNEKH